MMKSNIVAAALIGLALGVAADLLLGFGGRIPVLGCLFAPLAILFGLGLPILVGALAAAFGTRQGLLTTPSGIVDGALAAALAELISRLVSFCASLVVASNAFLGPRFLLPGVGRATGFIFTGVWALGWLVVSIAVAALLGAIGGLLYNAMTRR